jgi:hypothetical protein
MRPAGPLPWRANWLKHQAFLAISIPTVKRSRRVWRGGAHGLSATTRTKAVRITCSKCRETYKFV